MRLEFRGVYQSTYIQYLSELGGCLRTVHSLSERAVTIIGADCWQAELEPEDTVSFSKTIVIPRSFITFTGDPAAVSEIVKQFRSKAFRGGG